MDLVVSLFLVHILIILSVFDIYFQSKVIDGVIAVQSYTKPFTKRLVLFIADGLRSETFLNQNSDCAPYLRSKMMYGSSWGVSHTRVPTETRPGHVAIIAGFYEDPSAVFLGWQDNPVPFDSVFNQSTAAFSWGSPDVVPLFSNAYSNPNIFYYNYPEELQDLSGKNGSVEFLNAWVYDSFKATLDNINNDVFIRDLWNKPGIVFFFDLMSIDFAGHAFNAKSLEYLRAINHTDMIVRKLTELIDSYYQDSHTTYIFTSDHGMTDWGTHGAGSPTEIETPLIAWGAGINCTTCSDVFDARSPCAKNVSQTDIAVLMSVLLGQSIPVQSAGVLPVQYLNVSDKDKVDALLMNANQLIQVYLRKQHDVESSLAKFLYTPYIGFENVAIELYFKKMLQKIDSQSFDTALQLTYEFIDLVIDGTKYYDRYFQSIKLGLIALTIIGCILAILSEIVPLLLVEQPQEDSKPRPKTTRKFSNKVCYSICFLIISFYYFLKNSGIFVYLLLPIPFWAYAVINGDWFVKLLCIIVRFKCAILFEGSFYVTGLALMFAGFFHRPLLTLLMAVVMLWPLINSRIQEPIRTLWVLSSISIAVFPLLPTVGTEANITWVLLSGSFWFFTGILWNILSVSELVEFPLDKKILIQTISTLPVLLNVYIIDAHFRLGREFLPLNQALSYIFFLINFLMLFLKTSTFILPRFLSICISLGVMFLQFSSTIESTFPVALGFHLAVWIMLEISGNHSKRHIVYCRLPDMRLKRTVVQPECIRQSFFYLTYIVLFYFGIGNIDAASSYDIAWVRGFVTVFSSPYQITILILIKNLLPFLMITCAFRVIVLKTQTNVKHLFYMVLIFCDILGFAFLLNVTNEGSWQEIGQSILRFIIVEVTVLFLILLYGFASLIIRIDKHEGELDVMFKKDTFVLR